MKAFIAFSLLLACICVHAAQPEYFSSRKWVEQQSGTNATSQGERVFVGRFGPQKYAGILHFHEGVTLREIIDQTPFKGTTVIVHVLRADRRMSDEYLKVTSAEKPKYELKNLDVILLYENGPIIQT